MIEYIENELMDRASKGVFDPRIGEAPSTLFIYLFVWDRYESVLFVSCFCECFMFSCKHDYTLNKQCFW